MKKILFLIVTGFFLNGSRAQQLVIPFSEKPMVRKADKKIQPFANKARVISKSKKGVNYALPLDGMPCLVPDLANLAPMPNASQKINMSAIPNPFKKEELLPGQ
ncbi:MAG: hypothetical protein IPP31_11720 [Chitinophagaceae bacterium]|nr:hypothetical protein [Chitinophagaceae bacterium]